MPLRKSDHANAFLEQKYDTISHTAEGQFPIISDNKLLLIMDIQLIDVHKKSFSSIVRTTSPDAASTTIILLFTLSPTVIDAPKSGKLILLEDIPSHLSPS